MKVCRINAQLLTRCLVQGDLNYCVSVCVCDLSAVLSLQLSGVTRASTPVMTPAEVRLSNPQLKEYMCT